MNTKALEDFFAANWKLLVAVVAALVIAFVIVGAWRERVASKERAGMNALFTAQVAARDLAEKKKLPEAVAALDGVVKEHGGTRAAYEAQLQGADLLMDNGQFAEAVQRYEAARGLAKDDFSRVLVLYSLGIAQETAGQHQAAVGAYEEALKGEAGDPLRPEILLAAARCYEALGQAPKAVELYQQVQQKFANRPYYSGAASAFEKALSAGGEGKTL